MVCGRYGPAWWSAPVMLVAGVASAAAADLPAVRITADNPIPACASPARLSAFIRARNPALDVRFQDIATDYQRQGDALGLRWDIAVFHMLHETGDLTFTRGRRAVKAAQNNFASLGAVGATDTGESFPDVATGVRAHLEHLLVYAGQTIPNATAERTRKVQAWGVLKPWQTQTTGPIGYTEVFYHWGAKSKSTIDAVQRITTAFQAMCPKAAPAIANAPPAPALPKVAAIAPSLPPVTRQAPIETPVADVQAVAAPAPPAPLPAAAPESMRIRFGLGAGGVLTKNPPQVRVLNEPSLQPVATPNDTPKIETVTAAGPVVAASGLAGRAIPKAVEAPAVRTPGQKCRVWTASYGGARSVIVRSLTDGVVNFTVLDVNAGQEKREAASYIGAFAKGGTIAYEFPTQAKALEKAFDLCPEG